MKNKNPPKQKRNSLCSCGSNLKYKKCCLLTELEVKRQAEIKYRERMQQYFDKLKSRRDNASISSASFPINGTRNPWIYSLGFSAMHALAMDYKPSK